MDNSVIFIVVGCVIGFFIYMIVIRKVFRIDEQVQNQETIIKLLGQQLKQKGLPQEDLNKLMGISTEKKVMPWDKEKV